MPANQNSKSPPIDGAFFEFLEYHLSKTLANSTDKSIKWIWCDGVKIPADSQLNKQSILGSKQIETEAWLGVDGQDIYKMVIKFGPRSIKNLINGISIMDCIPGEELKDWINLCTDSKEIELQLN